MDATKYKPYPAYKDSGVEWLGKVPEHWEIDRLKWTVDGCINGIWGDDPDGENDIVCIRVADFDRSRNTIADCDYTLRSVVEKQRNNRLLRKGDLLIEKSGGGDQQPVGTVVIFDKDFPAVCSNFVARMPVRVSFNSKYLSYLHSTIYAIRLNTCSIKQNTGIQNLDSSAYLDERVSCPPFEEQHTIAAFLDHETAKIDTLIAKQERLIELLQEKRTALISHAVTKGLNPDASMKDSGVEWLGEVPEHWGMKRLKHISPKITVGIVVEPSKYYVDDGVPALRSLNIQPSKIVLENIVYISSDANELLLKSRLSAGDLVAVRSGQPGTTAVVPDDMDGINCIDLIIIRKPVHMSEKYLCWFMNSDGAQHQFVEGSGGAIQQHFNIGMAMNLISPYPPTQEQSHIVAFLDRETAKIDTLIAKARRAIDLLKERRTALISAAVTGKIDVREIVQSDDEKPLSRKRERGGGEGA